MLFLFCGPFFVGMTRKHKWCCPLAIKFGNTKCVVVLCCAILLSDMEASGSHNEQGFLVRDKAYNVL